MKTLLAIKSCEFDRARQAHDLIRNTWGRDVEDLDLIFFMGHGAKASLSDEIVLDTPDGYIDLPFKTREICRWAINRDYTHLGLLDTGSFLIPHHLRISGFDHQDYMGFWGMKIKNFSYTAEDINRGCPPVRIENCVPWASGGFYTLSRTAMNIIASGEPFVHAEDLWTAQELAKHGILLVDGASSGWRGKTCDWISSEKNGYPNAMEKRTAWMNDKYNKAKEICATEGCFSPYWAKYNLIESRDADQIEKVLEQRRLERRKK